MLGDEVAVMAEGRIVQSGVPPELYDGRPRRGSPASSATPTCSPARRTAPPPPRRAGRVGLRTPVTGAVVGAGPARGAAAQRAGPPTGRSRCVEFYGHDTVYVVDLVTGPSVRVREASAPPVRRRATRWTSRHSGAPPSPGRGPDSRRGEPSPSSSGQARPGWWPPGGRRSPATRSPWSSGPSGSGAWRPATRSPACGSTSAATACTRPRRRALLAALRASARRRPPGPAPPRPHPAPPGAGWPSRCGPPTWCPHAAAVRAARRPRRRPRPRSGAARGRTRSPRWCGPGSGRPWPTSSTSPTSARSGASTRPSCPASSPAGGSSAVGPAPSSAAWSAGRRPEGRTFLYPRRGFGQISERLADAAAAAGADHPPRRRGGAPRPLRADGADRVGSTAARRVAARPRLVDRAAARARRPCPTRPRRPRSLEAAGRLTHRAVVLAYLVLDRPQWTEFDAHYFPGARHPAGPAVRAQATTATAPTTRPTAPCCAPRCPATSATRRGTPTPDELADAVARRSRRMGLPAVDAGRRRGRRGCPRVYPRLPARASSATWPPLERWAAGPARRCSRFGRQGLFVPDNTHHALAMGWAAADALRPDGVVRRGAWAAARAGFRDLVVED